MTFVENVVKKILGHTEENVVTKEIFSNTSYMFFHLQIINAMWDKEVMHESVIPPQSSFEVRITPHFTNMENRTQVS